MAVAHRDMLQTSVPQPLQCDSEPMRTLVVQTTMAAAHNHNGIPSGGSGHCGGTSGDNAAQQPLLEALGIAPAMRTASGTGDDARRSSFWRLWVLPRGQPAAPAATTRAAAPSVKALDTAPATRKTASGTSGDNARRSPFWRLWTLRPPRGRQQAAPAATTRAAAPSGGSGYCACQEDSQRRQRAPQPFLEALATAPATRKKASGTSGDNARRSPCLEALDAVPATRNVEMI